MKSPCINLIFLKENHPLHGFFFPNEYFFRSLFLQVPLRQVLFVSNEERWSEFQKKKRSMN